MIQIRKSQYVFYEILEFLDVKNQSRMQLLSKKFYESIVPHVMSTISIRNSPHVQKQDKLFQYASGFIMYRDLNTICAEAELGPQSSEKWNFYAPKNVDYMRQHGLDKQLRFGRTIYIPYQKVIVISGSDFESPQAGPVRDVFQFHLTDNTVERLPSISKGRTSFAAHYEFEDRFIYVMGGSDKTELMLKECEKFDVFNHRWSPMPKMNFERGNPGSYLSADKRYLYAFQGFVNKFDRDGTPLRYKQSKALDSIERIDLWNESQGWELLDVEKETLTPKGCFVMHSLADIKTVDSKTALENKLLIFGGWKPYQNLSDIQVFDLKERRVCDTAKFAKGLKIVQQESGQMSAATAHESATSSGEELDQVMQPNTHQEDLKKFSFKFGDKFTKKPIQSGKYLILLGRIHIQLFDLETFTSKILLQVGEDQAEKLGCLLKTNPDLFKGKDCAGLSHQDFQMMATGPNINYYQRQMTPFTAQQIQAANHLSEDDEDSDFMEID